MTILLATVLKPALDARLWGRIAQPLATALPQAEVHIVGQGSRAEVCLPSNVRLHCPSPFRRLSLARLCYQYYVYRLLRRTKPDIVLISALELLPLFALLKPFLGYKLVYDVQENYFYNVLYTRIYPAYLRHILAYMAKYIEQFAAYRVDVFVLAESCYVAELGFVRRNYVLLENKLSAEVLHTYSDYLGREYHWRYSPRQPIRFIHSGTLAEEYGTFKAIAFVDTLRRVGIDAQLVLVGYCADIAQLSRIQSLLVDAPHLQLIGGDTPVSHALILQHITQADVALLPYRPNESYARRIPTKFYEYLALGVPMLVQQNAHWQYYLAQYGTVALMLDFWAGDANSLVQQLLTAQFRRAPLTAAQLSGEAQTQELIAAIRGL